MLAKKYRLPVQNFIGQKSRLIKKNPYFALKIFSAAQDFSRFGIVISKKVSKKATVRNRLKRQIFNFLRETAPLLPVADYLIILYPDIVSLNKSTLQTELKKVISQNINYKS